MKINLLNAYQGAKTKKNAFKFKRLISLMIIIGSAILALPQVTSSQTNVILTAPTILSPSASQSITAFQPVFAGVTFNNTKIDIYIDNVFNGRAKRKNGPSGIASWGYHAFQALDIGEHVVYAVARSDSELFRSPESAHIKFYIKAPFPAPTLFKPVLNNKTTYRKPWVVGLAKNNSFIEVFIDGILNGSFQVNNDLSGTANFAYKPFLDLKPGWHSVKVRAKDAKGKTSVYSNQIVFEIRDESQKSKNIAPQVIEDEHPEPALVIAPTLLEPETGTVTWNKKILISGLARNNQTIEIFIDNILNGEAKTLEHSNGIMSFAYKPYLSLKLGEHKVYAKATAVNGQKSSRSNTLSFLVRPVSKQIVVSPLGVAQTGIVKSTTTEVIKEIPEEKPIDEAPDEKQKAEAEEVGEIEKPSEIIVIGDKATTTAGARNNTLLIVILAIVAIIIIAIISWYTSREKKEPTQEPPIEPKQPEKPENPTPSDMPAWEEEPNYIPTPEADEEKTSYDDIPPPPPPPALGI